MDEEVILDDDELIKDYLLRTLHRNEDGHLGPGKNSHKTDPDSNVGILYIYVREEDAYVLQEFYTYSPEPLDYSGWCKQVNAEIADLEASADRKTWVGVYGWMTGFIRITPLRNGDLFIKIDKEGATGVRLAFSPRTDKHETRNQKKARQTKGARDRR